jgi:hypothetical protein
VIVDIVEMLSPILDGTTFTIVTNNISLSYFIKQTTIGERLTGWKMFLQSYGFTMIYNIGTNNIPTIMLSRIYEKRTADTEEEIMEDPTIKKSFSALTFLLTLSSLDQYSPLLYSYFTTSNIISSYSVLTSHSGSCYYKYQHDTITTMSGIVDDQAPSCFCNNEGYNCKYQDSRHVPIFREEAYKVNTTLENASLQLEQVYRIFIAPYFY